MPIVTQPISKNVIGIKANNVIFSKFLAVILESIWYEATPQIISNKVAK
jgi:hypothetical protein